jgi:hypothetical protein
MAVTAAPRLVKECRTSPRLDLMEALSETIKELQNKYWI